MLRRRTALSTTLAQGSTNNAVSRSDRFGTGHRLGIQNAPAGGPSQITDHKEKKESDRKTETCTSYSLLCEKREGAVFSRPLRALRVRVDNAAGTTRRK